MSQLVFMFWSGWVNYQSQNINNLFISVVLVTTFRPKGFLSRAGFHCACITAIFLFQTFLQLIRAKHHYIHYYTLRKKRGCFSLKLDKFKYLIVNKYFCKKGRFVCIFYWYRARPHIFTASLIYPLEEFRAMTCY